MLNKLVKKILNINPKIYKKERREKKFEIYSNAMIQVGKTKSEKNVYLQK